MAKHAATLVDHLLSQVPVRQWVLTLPYRLAWDHALCRAVLGVYARTLLAFYARTARARGILDGQTGTVTVILLDGVAAAGEARSERAVVLLELGLPLLLRLRRSALLLLHLPARAHRVDQPADPDTLHRAGAGVSRDRAARGAQRPTGGRTAPVSLALGRGRGGLGELHRVDTALLHGPVMALLLVPDHLLITLASGGIDVQILRSAPSTPIRSTAAANTRRVISVDDHQKARNSRPAGTERLRGTVS